MTKKRAFISSNRYELPFVRRIQLILESEHDCLTYINEWAEFEGSPGRLLIENARDLLGTEIAAHNLFFIVNSSQWRRSFLRDFENFMSALDDPDKHGQAFIFELLPDNEFVSNKPEAFIPFQDTSERYHIDIDQCWELPGESSYHYLERAVKHALENGRTAIDGNLPHTINELPEREQKVWQYAARLKTAYSEDLAREAIFQTRGEIAGLLGLLDQLDVPIFDDTPPPEMSSLETGLGKVIDWITRKPAGAWSQYWKRVGFDKILYTEFHVYPPHHPHGTIFISHSTRNLVAVRHLQLVLEEQGYRTFAFRIGSLEDTSFSGPEAISNVSKVLGILKKEINTCNFLVLARSPEFDASPWTFAEQALDPDKPTFAVDVSDLEHMTYSERHAALQSRVEEMEQHKEAVRLHVDEGVLPYMIVAQGWVNRIEMLSDVDIVNELVEFQVPEARKHALGAFEALIRHRYSHIPGVKERVQNIKALLG